MDSSNRVAALQLSHKTDILLQSSTASFLLVRATQKSHSLLYRMFIIGKIPKFDIFL